MVEQSNLSDFGAGENSETDLYECEICGREYDSAKGRGIHRANSHDQKEVKKVLLTELQRLANELGGTPKQTDMTQNGAHSTKTYQKKFGSWNEALKQADLEVNEEQNITRADLRDGLERLADELERTPTSRDMKTDGKYGSSTYINEFGSWNDAVQEVGLEPTRDRDVPREDLISEIQRIADELGKPPSTKEMKEHGCYGVSTCSNEFGTWNDALKSAGYSPNREKNISKTILKNELRRLSDEYSRPPTAEEMRRDGTYSVGTFNRQFGSWNNALEEDGFDLHNRNNIPQGELLDELTRLSDRLGRPPTAIDMESMGRFGWATYKDTFGSWNSALKQASLEVNNRSDIPETELLDGLRSLSDQLGRTPEKREMDQHGRFHSSTYMVRFGTWNDALKEAGFEPIQRRDIPKTELKSEIQRLASELNRPPTRDEMEQQGDFSYSVYRHRFGSWTDALIEAGFEPHKALNPDYLDHRVDSAHELVVADILLDAGLEYENEGIEIIYDDGRTYTPDFVTEDYVIEVKGQDWGEMYNKEVTAKRKAEAAMDALNSREYVVVGVEIPADIHISWEDRETIRRLFE